MSRLISHEEVQKHSTDKSIWMVIHNDVYDVTGFLEEHPGGADSLLDFAGKDGTQAFEDVAHSEDARELMKKYKIGTVPENERTGPKPAQTSPCEADNSATGPCGYCPLGPDSEPRSSRPPTSSSAPGSSQYMKWALIALAGAVIIGFTIKSLRSKSK